MQNFLEEINLEDSGTTSHPVMPERYQEIDNFYTTTIYEKGSEIIRCNKLVKMKISIKDLVITSQHMMGRQQQ